MSKTLYHHLKPFKYFAMTLFVLLPFVSFVVGMNYEELSSNISSGCSSSAPGYKSGMVCKPKDRKPANSENICTQNGGKYLADYNECEGITQQQCDQSGGTFTECAANCRHDPDYPNVYCIQVCVPVCSFK